MLRLVLFISLLLASWLSCAEAAPRLANPIFQTLSTQNGLPQDIVNDIAIDEEGFVWVATEGGLARWDGYRAIQVKGPDNIFVNASIFRLFIQDNQYLWISTFTNGIYRYNLDTTVTERVVSRPYRNEDQWIQYASNFQLADDGQIYLSLDQEVVRVDPDTLQIEPLFALTDEQVDQKVTNRFTLKIDDMLLVATTNGLFARQLGTDKSVIRVDYLNGVLPDVDNVNVKFLLDDPQGRVWVGTVKGLYMASRESLVQSLRDNTAPAFTRILAKENVWEMKQKGASAFWVGTNKGLFELRQENAGWVAEHIIEPHNGVMELSNKKIGSIEPDSLGNLWLGTEYGGALYFGTKSAEIETLQNTRLADTASLSHSSVFSIRQTNEDTLWIGTENGINRHDIHTHQTAAFLKSDNTVLPESESGIAQIYPTPDGNLYLQTWGGLRVFNTRSGQLSIPPLNNRYDAPIFEAWSAGSAIDQNGRLYFISDKFYRYDPKKADVEVMPLPETVFKPIFSHSFLGVSPYYNNRMFLSMLGGLWLIDTDTFEHELVYRFTEAQRKGSVGISSWLVDKSGTLWLAFPGQGILGLDADTFEAKYHLHDKNLLLSNIVYGLQADSDGDLWFSSHAGLHSYSPTTGKIRHFTYGQDLSVSEFNEGAATTLTDGRMAYGSTQGLVIFEPETLKRLSDVSGRFTRQMAITDVTLDSRNLSPQRRNLNGQTLDFRHDDYGVTIYFTPLVMGADRFATYHYKLLRNGDVLTQGVTSNSRITFGTLQPGDYEFNVAATGNSFPFAVLPAKLKISVPYAPWRSPLAYSVYALVALLLVAAYLISRQRYIQRLKAAKEQVALFYDAFRHTRDWVIIFDSNKKPVAANPAFENIFGLSNKENLGRQIRRLYAHYPKLVNLLSGRLTKMRPGEFWKDEGVVEGNDGRQYDVLIDITAIGDEDDNVAHYLLVISDISEQKSAERKLIKIANYDSLTGLVNRSLLIDRLEHAIAGANSHNHKVAVLFVDLDRFKGINDSLGHDFGDKLLRVVASRMKNLVPEDGTVARLGGDEFVIVLEEVDDAESMGYFVSELINVIETPIALGSETLRVSCSVGLAFYPDDGNEPSELLKHADVAMYAAKKDMLNSFTFFTQDMNERARHRLAMENQVKRIFTEDGFYNHYQPIVNVTTGKVEGLELLLRAELDGQPVYPDTFIPILEQLKYIIDVTRDAMKRAVENLADWYAQGYRGYLSVNLSALHFKTDFDIDGTLALLDAHGLPASALRFEITEGVLMDDTDNAFRQITRFAEAGFILALDDFGTGYSSLSYLKRYPLSVLKIDKSFVNEVSPGNANDALVVTTINLAASLKMESVAEGVETREQAEYLANNGCVLHQGYYYSRPVAADAVPPLLGMRW
ncbi:EAL domain-containing protein [Alteromonas sp. CYL-A6]|uniref:EAL domain-containing protein n=1 Tax=Alteromonas nitratireducens TaxID=3390813 RepID=UPI0034BF55C8